MKTLLYIVAVACLVLFLLSLCVYALATERDILCEEGSLNS